VNKQKLPEGWKEVELPEVVWFQEGPGVRKHQFTTKGIKLINGRNIVNNKLTPENTETHISKEEATTKYKHFLIDEGDLIIASSGIKVDYFHKKIAFAKKEDLPLCMNTSTIRFKSLDKKNLDINYFKYFLMTHNFAQQVQFHITGSAQLNFGPSHLKQMKIILPPIEIQHKLVSLFDKIAKTKDWRKEADDLTKDFLESVFLEMFWDKNKFENIKINEVIEKTSNDSPSKDYPDKEFEYIDISSIDNSKGKIISSKKLLGKDAPSRAKQKVKYKDLIISTVRPNLNSVALVPKHLENQICSTGFCVLRANTDKVSPEFLFHVARSSKFIGAMVKIAKGASYPAVSDRDIKNYEIPLPPIELQNKFASIVKEVEAMKEQQKHSKDQIDNLFNALMQKAFKGELKC